MIPGSSPLLHIYDATDLSIDLTASIRSFFGPPQDIHKVPVSDGISGLRRALDKLVQDRRTFPRAIFETHGSSGSIYFADQPIDGETWRNYYSERGYEKIFSYIQCRIYFNGCNVADEPHGWDFLDAAGSVFLKLGGGITFAQTGVGRVLIHSGHVAHFGEKTMVSRWAPGGIFLGHK